jgi:hypothetical protein
MMNQVTSISCRVVFVVAFFLAGVAIWEKVANWMGYHLTFIGYYAPSRFLELSAIALLFVIALQLREIKAGIVGSREPG